jgi:hypothetical protein
MFRDNRECYEQEIRCLSEETTLVKRLKHNINTDHQNTGYDIFKSFDVAFYDREDDEFFSSI